MESSFTFETSLNKWRNYLRDINFWLNGYQTSSAYRNLEGKVNYYGLQWNLGIPPASSFTRSISSIMCETKMKDMGVGPFDLVIKVNLDQATTLGNLDIMENLAVRVAEELDLLRQEDDGIRYYSYNQLEHTTMSLRKKLELLVPQINQKLIGRKYLLVVENVYKPVESVDFSVKVGLPPWKWNDSRWIISTTSQDVYAKSNLGGHYVVKPSKGDDIVILTLYSMHQSAKYILAAIGHKDEQYWHRMAIQCFHYAAMLLMPHCSSLHGDEEGPQSTNPLTDITSDELIRQWTTQGILTIDQERTGGATAISNPGKYNDIYQVGNVILEAFREYSLLELPFSPATTKAEQATKSAAHFLACHNLITEHHTTDQLCEREQPSWLERTQWILHVGDQGWHLSREWLSHGASSTSTLILRHCSQQSRLHPMLDHLLAKIPSLCVLDLSYSSVESLPPSVSCLKRLQLLYLSHTPLKSLSPSIFGLQKLQLLCLRGCYNIKSPFSFSDTDIITLPENKNNTEIGLLHLDLSHSTVKTFHCDFFRRMPNLQELLLLKCSNLEELPISIASLSSLEKLELTGTQLKSFPVEIFEEMKNLQSVKIIENKNLLLRRLSLHGCRKLEYIDIKEAGSLEELDLSATAIKELPDSIPNLPRLRRLLLLGVPFLRRFPWHKLQRLPDMFCLDQCSNSTINYSDHPQSAQVSVSDSRLFYSFNEATRDLVKAGKLLKTFYVRVTSCKAISSSKLKDEGYKVMTNTLQLAPAAYDDINRRYLTDGVSMVSMDDVPPCLVTKRHVEISAADRYPHGLKYLLSVTKSISMWDDTHVSCLNDLSDLDDLEECKLQRCHKIVHVFNRDAISMRSSMKNAFVSHLRSLTHFYYKPNYCSYPFYELKHLVLVHCPRLEGVVASECELRKLETLDILSCYNLKAIFYDNGYSSSGGYKLPCLRRISLQELPLLEHVHVDNPKLTAPAWKELHVRGCWSLRSLPRFRQQPDKAVEVSGERAWWNKLRWDQDDNAHRDSYEPMLPPAFASRRERVVIKSYLR